MATPWAMLKRSDIILAMLARCGPSIRLVLLRER